MKLGQSQFSLFTLSAVTVWLWLSLSTVRLSVVTAREEDGGGEDDVEIDLRIVGGQPADTNEFPWFSASISGSLCGASLIHERVLLTAAHCLRAFRVGADVYVSAKRFQSSTGGAVRRTITQVVTHPDYATGGSRFANDLMLVLLDEEVPNVPLVEINQDDSIPLDDQSVTVMGFGATEEDGNISLNLRKVEIKKDTDADCRSAYFNSYLSDVMVCASDPNQDSCQGDSGN